MSTLTFTEQVAPSTPSAGKRIVYLKADGFFYSKDSAGVEAPLTDGINLELSKVASNLYLNSLYGAF